MTNTGVVCVTTGMLWRAAFILALIDTIFLLLLIRFIDAAYFRSLKWKISVTSAGFWGLLWLLMSMFYWDPVYHYVFPEWTRWLIPPAYGLLFGAIGLVIWWLGCRFPAQPVLSYCLFGGIVGSLTHIWAIHRGILQKPPMLRGVAPISAVVMPFFEFAFYWCVILGMAVFFSRVFRSRSSKIRD